MRMREVNKISNVLSLFSQKDGIAYKTDDSLVIKGKNISLKKDEYVSENNHIIYKTNKSIGELYVYENGEFSIRNKNGFTAANFFFDVDNYVALKLDLENKSSLYYVKVNDFENIFKINGIYSICYFDTKNVILCNLNRTEVLSVNTKGAMSWQFNIPEGFKIFGDMQIMGNILFIDTHKNVNEAKILYGLDISTGKTVWELHYQIPYDTNFAAYNFNKENNLGYGFGGKFYQVFNPSNGKMLLTKDMSEYYKQGVSPNPLDNSIADGRLWFISGEGKYSDRNTKFGAINLETSEMDFIQDFSLDKGGMPDKPVFCNGKLYLLDKWNKVLHVFEETK